MTYSVIPVTLFPEMFPGQLGHSLAGKALEEHTWSLQCVNIRDFGLTKHKQVDDSPYGGGAGMVMRPDVVDAALQRAHTLAPHNKMIYLSPRGTPFSQKIALDLSRESGLTLLCGRFEGIDERVTEKWELAEISLGDYILSGGETAALTLLDAVIRLLPGVMGNDTSSVQESFSQDLLEYPQYTRPQTWDNKIVPDVLLSGDHQKIADWRQVQAEKITKTRRPDLWNRYTEKKGES